MEDVDYKDIFVNKSVRGLYVGDETVSLNLIGEYKFCVRAVIKDAVSVNFVLFTTCNQKDIHNFEICYVF